MQSEQGPNVKWSVFTPDNTLQLNGAWTMTRSSYNIWQSLNVPACCAHSLCSAWVSPNLRLQRNMQQRQGRVTVLQKLITKVTEAVCVKGTSTQPWINLLSLTEQTHFDLGQSECFEMLRHAFWNETLLLFLLPTVFFLKLILTSMW